MIFFSQVWGTDVRQGAALTDEVGSAHPASPSAETGHCNSPSKRVIVMPSKNMQRLPQLRGGLFA